MRELHASKRFLRNLKRHKKRNIDIEPLRQVVKMLLRDEKLPEKYRNHGLSGEYIGIRECHIRPNWLLLYELSGDKLVLILNRTGSHSDIFCI